MVTPLAGGWSGMTTIGRSLQDSRQGRVVVAIMRASVLACW
jgi:hypothetical protein